MIESILKELGLNDKEIVLYLELLSLGTCPASTLAKRTGITKSTVRYACQQLEKKKLILSIEKDNTFMYSAESPEKLMFLLEEEKRKIEKKEQKLSMVMGELNSRINRDTVLPKVQFFEGKDGVEKLYQSILDLGAPIDSFEDSGEMNDLIPEFVQYFVSERKKRKIFNRVICPSENTINIDTPEEFRSTKFLFKKDFPFTCDVKICGDTVNIASFKKSMPVAVTITDEEVAKNFRVLFEYMWKLLDEK